MIEKALCNMICDMTFEVKKSVLFPGHNVMLKGKGTFFLKDNMLSKEDHNMAKEYKKQSK